MADLLSSDFSIRSFHKAYQSMFPKWQKCRDVLSGEETIKEKGTVYLPKPSGLETYDYNLYKERAAFVELTGRARDAMVGLVERKKPVLTTESETIEEYAEDITLTGEDLDDFAFDVLSEVVDSGRAGVLVDFPTLPTMELTRADMELENYRPYTILYKAEDIIDWREGRKGNRRIHTYLKLRETFEEPAQDNFHTTVERERIRVLRLDESGYCVFEVYENTADNTWALLDNYASFDRYVYMSGEKINFIPFVFFGPFKNSPEVQKPPLLAMANLNIHHYQASADRNHAVHYADVPTPYSTQPILTDDGQIAKYVKLGPTNFIQMANGGELKFLEMLGHGIEPTKQLMDEYVMQMSILGNKILAMDSRAAEAAETASIHRAGEQAILAAIANNVSKGITEVLKIMLEYVGEEDDDLFYQLSTDYLPYSMDSQTLIALIGAVTAGKLSDKEFFEALVAGEVVRPNKTWEEHKEEIEAMPKMSITPDSGGTFGVPDKGIANAAKGGEELSTEIDGMARQDSSDDSSDD